MKNILDRRRSETPDFEQAQTCGGANMFCEISTLSHLSLANVE